MTRIRNPNKSCTLQRDSGGLSGGIWPFSPTTVLALGLFDSFITTLRGGRLYLFSKGSLGDVCDFNAATALLLVALAMRAKSETTAEEATKVDAKQESSNIANDFIIVAKFACVFTCGIFAILKVIVHV